MGNAIAVPESTYYPVIMRRVFGNRSSRWANTDGFVTSTDLGVTWSVEEFPLQGSYAKPQYMSVAYNTAPFLSGRYWAPICTDGVDFYAIQSSNSAASGPRVEYMTGLELVV